MYAYPAYGQVPVGMIRRVSVASGNEYPMRPASYIRTAPTVYPSSSPAGTWFAGNAPASSCGFRDRYLIVCSHQTPHVPGKRDNSWSTRAQPVCRAHLIGQITVAAPDARAEPYCVSFASSSASSIVLKVVTASTGPKISSGTPAYCSDQTESSVRGSSRLSVHLPAACAARL